MLLMFILSDAIAFFMTMSSGSMIGGGGGGLFFSCRLKEKFVSKCILPCMLNQKPARKQHNKAVEWAEDYLQFCDAAIVAKTYHFLNSLHCYNEK